MNNQAAMNFLVKICGITTARDAVAAASSGADAIGLNFYSRSLRSVTTAEAVSICEAVRQETRPENPTVQIVGVFVDHSVEQIIEIMSAVGLDVCQLHGDQPPEVVMQLKQALAQPMVRAIRAGNSTAAQVQAEIDQWVLSGIDGILLDSAPARRPRDDSESHQELGGAEFGSTVFGGTGHPLNWDLVAGLKIDVPWVLAGGLSPENVFEAIETTRAPAVDVASGVERLPGNKDTQMVEAFVSHALTAISKFSRLD